MNRSILVLLLLAASGCATAKKAPAILESSRQLVVVTTPSWEATTGTMELFEREHPAASWRRVDTWPVVVGRTGLAWGRGIESLTGAEPSKREGDGKAPAGVFRLSGAFGYAEDAASVVRDFPYLALSPSIECVDDTASAWYNQTLDRNAVAIPDWKSSETMRRTDDLYRWGVFVDHNTAPVVRGAGSCIFLHNWSGPASVTAGCTAMEEGNLIRLLGWLDRDAAPLLVQLPLQERAGRAAALGLPER